MLRAKSEQIYWSFQGLEPVLGKVLRLKASLYTLSSPYILFCTTKVLDNEFFDVILLTSKYGT